MNTLFIRTIVAVLAISSLPACSDSPPKCADEGTVALVLQIVQDSLHRQTLGLAPLPELSLTAVRTTKVDGQTGAQFCEAELRMKQDFMNHAMQISYKSEWTDDGKDQYVTVYGL